MQTTNPFIEKSSSGIQFSGYSYTYVLNNPLKYTDPSGYKKLDQYEIQELREQEAAYAEMMSNLSFIDDKLYFPSGGGGENGPITTDGQGNYYENGEWVPYVYALDWYIKPNSVSFEVYFEGGFAEMEDGTIPFSGVFTFVLEKTSDASISESMDDPKGDIFGWIGTTFAAGGEAIAEHVKRSFIFGYYNVEGTKTGYYTKDLKPINPKITRYGNSLGWAGAAFTLGSMYFNTTQFNSSDPTVVMQSVNDFFINGFSLIPGWTGVAVGVLGVPIQSLGEIGAKNFQENNVSFEHYHVIPGLGPSDSALKENLKPIQGAVERIQLIAGYTFTWKQDSTNTQDIGVIAQEVEVVFPEAVTENPEQGTKLVYYYKLVPVLIEAIKEQQEVIEEQQKEIDRLIESVEDLQIERN